MILSTVLKYVFPGQNTEAVIVRPSPKTAYIRYSPTKAEQLRESDRGVKGQFVVEYDIDHQDNAGEILVSKIATGGTFEGFFIFHCFYVIFVWLNWVWR